MKKSISESLVSHEAAGFNTRGMGVMRTIGLGKLDNVVLQETRNAQARNGREGRTGSAGQSDKKKD